MVHYRKEILENITQIHIYLILHLAVVCVTTISILVLIIPKSDNKERNYSTHFILSFVFQSLVFVSAILTPVLSVIVSFFLQFLFIALALGNFHIAFRKYEYSEKQNLIKNTSFFYFLLLLQGLGVGVFCIISFNVAAQLTVMIGAYVFVYYKCARIILRNQDRNKRNKKVIAFFFFSLSLLPILNLISFLSTDLEQYKQNGLTFFSILLFLKFCLVIFVILSDAIEVNEKMAITDPLTGLFNRRHFYKKVSDTNSKNVQCRALVICDIDNFKQVNDTYGHSIGDIVIKSVGEQLVKNVRQGDMVARLGGEEFGIYLEEDDIGRCIETVERLRKSLHRIVVNDGEVPVSITASFGVAIHQNDSVESSVHKADQAMYNAKNTGKDKVCIADSALLFE
jgi:diguanylate cyclase (GGDEF)-like protein